MNLDQLRYPLGRFRAPKIVSPDHIEPWIEEIDRFPTIFREVIQPLTPGQLETPYRPGGWTVRQVVHHLSDSHLNSFVRYKWALTKSRPTIKAYHEDLWAMLPDYSEVPVSISLRLLDLNIGGYAWRGRHHMAHITSLAERERW